MDGLTWVAFYSIIQLKKYNEYKKMLMVLVLFVLEVLCGYFTWTYTARNYTFAYDTWFYLQIIVTLSMQFARELWEGSKLSQGQKLAIQLLLVAIYLSIAILAYVIILHENTNPVNAELISVLVIYPFMFIIHLVEIRDL